MSKSFEARLAPQHAYRGPTCWLAQFSDKLSADQTRIAVGADGLSGLPPTFVSVAELDLLRDEAMDYAQRLMQSGVKTELHVYPGTFHGSITFAQQAASSLQHQTDVVRALKRELA